MQSIILVRPEHPGNIGAVARVMANFGFKNLILVSPVADYKSDEAFRRAKHGKSVLEKAKVVKSLKNAKQDWLIATSGKLGSDYNIPRLPLTPWQLRESIAGKTKRNIGIVFGPESSGLSNEEVELADCFVTIPADKNYPILNLSHSVGIILYELSLDKSVNQFTPLQKKDKEILENLIDETLNTLSFDTKDKQETQKMLWHRLIGKSFLTRREGFALMGFFKKVLKRR